MIPSSDFRRVSGLRPTGSGAPGASDDPGVASEEAAMARPVPEPRPSLPGRSLLAAGPPLEGCDVHGRFYRAGLWRAARAAVETAPAHQVDRRA